MAKFLTGKELNESIYNIIWNAKEKLVVVSPFIKLDDYFKKLFEYHKHRHKLHILIIFGKNESSPNKSLSKNDFLFFKQFKNISIVYCPNLHAKYYANESEGLLSSINLYDYSFENNIEYGLYHKVGLIDLVKGSDESDVWNYTLDLANKHPVIFARRPVYEKEMFSKKYIDSEIVHDITDRLVSFKKGSITLGKTLIDFEPEIDLNETKERPIKPEASKENARGKNSKLLNSNDKLGFCIRTGRRIPFNVNKPMCLEAYESWVKWENYDYPEAYCHLTGKESFGKTCMRKPVLGNWEF